MLTRITFLKLRFWCYTGLLICCYAAYVETKAESDPNYKAFCDINPGISCTSVFTSPYGRGFGLLQYFFDMKPPPNGIIGMMFFMFAIFSTYCQNKYLFGLFIFFAFVANLVSIYLGYLLFFVLDEICVVCLCAYLANYFILRYALQFYREKWVHPQGKSNTNINKNN